MATKLECEWFNWCWAFFGKWSTGSLNPSQAAQTLAGSLFTENVDVENIILRFKGKEICCDEDWDVIVKAFKAAREADRRARAAIRVFPVDVGKRQ